jgi:hypothetical protein
MRFRFCAQKLGLVESTQALDIETSESEGFSRFYYVNNVLTIYYNKTLASLITASFATSSCVPNLISTGRNNFFHDLFHKNKMEKEEYHFHLMLENYNIIHPNEIECIFKNVKSFEKENELCLISDKDLEILNKAYSNYYQNNKEKDYTDETLLYDTFTPLVQSFYKILIDHYLKPFLINKGLKLNHATLITDVINWFMLFLFTSSAHKMFMNAALVKSLPLLLEKMGLNKTTAEQFVSGVSSFLTCYTHPLSVLNPMRIQSVMVGQKAAFQLIKALPKLKAEDNIMGTDSEPVKDESMHMPEGLRRRSLG